MYICIEQQNYFTMASKVYFTDLRTRPGHSLLQKLEAMVKRAGMEQIDFKDKYVAIKIHFGEFGNVAYIRPNYAAVIVKLIKDLGGKPFLTVFITSSRCLSLYTNSL